jgi:hypothetical protein
VGGTTLNLTSQGNYLSESPWSQSGTGTSPFESQPSWQVSTASAAGLPSSGRTTPDVAFDANPSTGVAVYDSVPYSGKAGWFTVGGTSVGAPSWAGLIAIADQGLAQQGVGSLSNAQASLYQISSSSFNQPTTGSASTTYALGTGLGSPKASQVVSALVQLSSGHGTTQTTVAAPAKNGISLVTHGNVVVVTAPTDPTTGTTSSSTSSASTTSITALTPTTTTANSPGLNPVIIVPVPISPPVVFHLGSSGSPVTAQLVASALAASEEVPPSTNTLGQELETRLQKQLEPRLGPKTAAPWLIDIVEPFQPLDPADSASGTRDLGPGAVGGWDSRTVVPDAVDAVLEASNGGIIPLAARDLLWLARRRLRDGKTWELSTLFGVAAVTAGGFHLAMRESQRFKTRWLPGRTSSSLPPGRWPGFRGR